MSGKRQLNSFQKILLSMCIIAVSIVGIVLWAMDVPGEISNAIAENYHNAMAPVLANPNFTPDGQMAVAFADGQYTNTYIPQSLRTNDPTQVRYILHLTKDSEPVGVYYGASGTRGHAYQYIYTVELEDLTTGQIIATNSFEGGDPPSSVSSFGDHYGSPPSSYEIASWVRGILGD